MLRIKKIFMIWICNIIFFPKSMFNIILTFNTRYKMSIATRMQAIIEGWWKRINSFVILPEFEINRWICEFRAPANYATKGMNIYRSLKNSYLNFGVSFCESLLYVPSDWKENLLHIQICFCTLHHTIQLASHTYDPK